MDRFTISELSRFSGLKPHTIRIWEQRYNALKPKRSEGNTRHYDSSQVRRLLNIVSLSSFGHKSSELCQMSDEQLFRLVKDLQLGETGDPNAEYFISQLTAAGLNYDEHWFEKTYASCIIRYGIKDAYKKVIYPLIKRVGVLWSCDGYHPGNEHFISNLLRQKLFSAIDTLPPAKESADTWICFLPEDEFHEIGLLFASFLIRQSGNKVIYLGSNVPLKALKSSVEETKAVNLLTFFVSGNRDETLKLNLNHLSVTFRKHKIFVATSTGIPHNITVKKNIILLNSVEDLDKNLNIFV